MKKLLLTILLLLSCTRDTHRKHIFFRMDTVTEITISVPWSFNPAPIWRSIDSLLIDYEKRFSVAGNESEVKALNERISDTLTISQELGEILKAGLAWGDSLDGAFDITVLPLKKLWGFCEECTGEEPLPDSLSVGAAAALVDYKNVRVNDRGDSVFFGSPDTRVDVGGIAKGFALKRIAALLKDRGVGNFLIASGGDILAFGHRGDNAPWRVGVRHPRVSGELVTTMPITNGTVVTSGDYERFRVIDGKRYHHIFDPKTGYSCESNQSVTIIANDPITADVLSTGLFCKDAENITAYIRERDDIAGIVVDANGEVFEIP